MGLVRAQVARTPLFVALLIGTTTACSLLLTTSEDQCATDADCPGRGAEFVGARCVESVCVAPSADAGVDAGPGLVCLGNHPTPKPTGPTATATWHFTDLLSGAPVTSLSVRVCPNQSDPTCGTPSATKSPDATGHVAFDLDLSAGPFTGYIAVDPILADGGAASTDPDGGRLDDEYIRTRFFYDGVPIADRYDDEESLFTYGTMRSFSSLYDLEVPDPKLGIVFLYLQDCQDNSLAGGIVDIDQRDPKTLSFYFFQNAPALGTTSTDESGNVGFINVPTGARRFTGKIAATQQPLGSVTLFSFPDTISIAPLGPAYTP